MRSKRANWLGALSGIVSTLVLIGMFPTVIRAEPAATQDPLIEHLEFLGYECDLVEAGIRARHFSKIHLYITYAHGGIRFQTGFPGKPPYSDVGSRYKITNGLSRQMSIMQLYWSDDGNLFAMGWMPGTYDKARFAVFMESWERDTNVLRKSYPDIKPFLKENPTPLSSS